MQKSMNLVDEFGRSDCSENEAKKTSTSTKESTKANYLFFNHVSHAISNFVSNFIKNVSNYSTLNANKAWSAYPLLLQTGTIYLG